jgi:hypothetical protein
MVMGKIGLSQLPSPEKKPRNRALPTDALNALFRVKQRDFVYASTVAPFPNRLRTLHLALLNISESNWRGA